jgi:hypothetical protein
MPSNKYQRSLVLVLVFATLVGFVVIVSRAIFLTITLPQAPTFSDAYVYVANISQDL